MVRCAFCGELMIWQNDFTYDDYCLDGEGIVSVYRCSECKTTAGFYHTEEEEDE